MKTRMTALRLATIVALGVLVCATPASSGVYSERGRGPKAASELILALERAGLSRESAEALLIPMMDVYPASEPPPAFDGVFLKNLSDVTVTIKLEGWETDMAKDGGLSTPSKLEANPRPFLHRTVTLPAGTSIYATDVRPPDKPDGTADPDAGKKFNGVGKIVATVNRGGDDVELTLESSDFIDAFDFHWRRGIFTHEGAWPTLTVVKELTEYKALLVGWADSARTGDTPTQYPAAPVPVVIPAP